ncbi:MAG: transcription antitermination factor NusB [Planctomycetota bacterium]
MGEQEFKTARAVAVETLNRWNPNGGYVGSVLERLLDQTEQRQRATDLVFGTLRNRRAIDIVITTFSGRPVERIQSRLLNIIRIGVYELVYSPATEEYAIVHETVENAKAIAGTKQTGFVNAVMRQITKHVTDRQIPLSQAKSERTIPQTPAAGCQFDTGLLPDDEARPVEYLSTVFSLPEWLVTDWLAEFGAESTRRICFASNRRPSIYIRPNALKTTTVALAEKLRQAGIELETSPDEAMIKIRSPQAVTQLPGFAEGEFTVQDVTASLAVRLLKPQPDWMILDLCAAPGVKTTQLAEATGDSAKIIATDIDARRLEMLKQNIARLGINSIDIVACDKLPDSKFDCILLDVPCSNTGVLARRVEARYRIDPQAIEKLAKVQGELLRAAAAMVDSHGRICYSTCSIQKDENAKIVADFLDEKRTFVLESDKLTLPSAEGFGHDGGYTAILARKQ